MKRIDAQGLNLNLRIIREPAVAAMSARKREVCWNFGIPPREQPFAVVDGLSVELRAGSILLIVGPSGSGKTSVLATMAEQIENVCWVGSRRLTPGKAVVDTIAPRAELGTALEVLTACGLGEPRLWVRCQQDLSDGEKFRAALARAVGESIAGEAHPPIFCDEFTAILHRRTAKAISYNLRKLVTRAGLLLVAATTHEDIIEDLQPDQILRLGGLTPTLTPHRPRDKAISLQRRAIIEPGSVRDYRTFAPMHYRHRDGLGFVDKVFLLKERAGGDPLGILVFAHAPMELSMRNLATRGRFVRNLRRLNRELRILRRLVMHPDVRGCGLGHWFVEQTLPRVGVRFIECLAAMGAVNPVFEKAGMSRIGRCPLPRGRLALLEKLRKWKLDPFADDFQRKIARLPRVRAMVEQTIQGWVAVTYGAAQIEIAGRPAAELARSFRQQIGEPPLYYLWDREGRFPRKEGVEIDDAKHRPDRPCGFKHELAEKTSDSDSRRRDRHAPDRA